MPVPLPSDAHITLNHPYVPALPFPLMPLPGPPAAAVGQPIRIRIPARYNSTKPEPADDGLPPPLPTSVADLPPHNNNNATNASRRRYRNRNAPRNTNNSQSRRVNTRAAASTVTVLGSDENKINPGIGKAGLRATGAAAAPKGKVSG